MFHYGDYVGSQTGSGVGCLGFNNQTADDTVVLIYRATMGSCGVCDDARYENVRFRWQNGKVVAPDPIPKLFG